MVLGKMREMKDNAIAKALKAYFNERFDGIADIQELVMDSGASRISLRVQLKGEREVLTASVDRYELGSNEHGRYIMVRGVSTSKAWLTTLAERRLNGKPIRIPAAVSALL